MNSMNTSTMFTIFILFLTICRQLGAKPMFEDFSPTKYIFRRNFITRELFYKNLTRIGNPDTVRRLRLIVGVNQAATESGFAEVYRIKVRWLEPDYWWDGQGQQGDLPAVAQRHYELKCVAEEEDTGNTHTFVKMNIDHSIMGYDEHFMSRRSKVMAACGIRCVNSVGFQSQWIWTNALKLHNLYDRSSYRRHRIFDYAQQQQQRQQQTPSYFEQANGEEGMAQHQHQQQQAVQAYFPWGKMPIPPPQQQQQPFEFEQQQADVVEKASATNHLEQIFSPPSSSSATNPSSSSSLESETAALSPPPPPPPMPPSPMPPKRRSRYPLWEMMKWRNSGKPRRVPSFAEYGFS